MKQSISNMFQRLANVNKKLIAGLVLFHVSVMALSNFLITIPLTIWIFPMTWAAFSFPLIVVATDLTVRLINKQNARLIINLAFLPAMFVSMWVIHANGNPVDLSLRVGVASGCSYLASNLLDVYVFQKVRERFKQWWAAPFGSSILANYIDTFTFFAVAFHNSTNQLMRDHWPNMAFNQASTKVVVSLCVVLPLYGLLLNYLGNRFGINTSRLEVTK